MFGLIPALIPAFSFATPAQVVRNRMHEGRYCPTCRPRFKLSPAWSQRQRELSRFPGRIVRCCRRGRGLLLRCHPIQRPHCLRRHHATGTAPINKFCQINILFAALNLGDIALPASQAASQLHLRQARLPADFTQQTPNRPIDLTIKHQGMLYFDPKYSRTDYFSPTGLPAL